MSLPGHADLAARLGAGPLAAVADALADVGGCWLVGGAVRDLLLGREPHDLDVVVEATGASGAAEAAARRLGGQARVHERFGTATVRAGALAFDVAGARRERYPAPGALPEVSPGSLDDDLRRRDFTVHAVAACLDPARAGELRHPPEALDDLESGRMRVMHDTSFLDDPTRLLRLVRYGARLGFATETHTQALARTAIAQDAMGTVSGARVGRELLALTGEDAAAEGLRRAAQLGLAAAIHSRFAPDPDLAAAALAADVSGARPELVVLAASATGFDSDAELRAWLDDLALEAPARDAVIAAALDGPRAASELSVARAPSQIAAAAAGRAPELLAMAAALGARAQVDRWERELRGVRPDLSGADLTAAGVVEGPAVGAGLAAALAAKLDGVAPGREEQLQVALEAAGAGEAAAP